jgi:hypothetical protein
VTRTAELSRRSALTFVTRPASIVVVILALLLTIATISFGLLAWPRGESLFYFYGGGIAGGGGEFQGFGYGVPILVSLALLAVAVWFSTVTPSPSTSRPGCWGFLSHAGVGLGVGFAIAAVYFLVRAVSLVTRNPFSFIARGSVKA